MGMTIENTSESSSSRNKTWVRGPTTTTITKSSTVCRYWKAGRCTRRPCRFLHGEPLNPIAARPTPKSIAPTPTIAKRSKVWKREDSENLLKFQESSSLDAELPALPPGEEVLERKETENITKTLASPAKEGRKRKSPEICNLDDVVCRGFIAGTCNDRENCSNRHAYCISDGFSDLACLEGHSDAVTGIALLSGRNKLFSGSKDKTVKIWDCGTGKCAQVVNVEGEVGCIKSVGAWCFVGIPNVVKVWNMETCLNLSLEGPKGQVHALETSIDTLFAGAEDGSISAWKPTADGKSFLLAATLGGHKKSVVSLVLCATKLYSGSMDCTIRAWDVTTLQCTHTVTGHQSVVTSLLRWEQFLISCSLDQTIKTWCPTQSGGLEETHSYTEEHGVLALCGMHDDQGRPVLLYSCTDNRVHVVNLPFFSNKGRIYSKEEVKAIHIGPHGLFFTGDGAGELKVWKWLSKEK